jgi:hypothetical protein
MAGFTQVTAQYNPFSFQEMLSAVQIADSAHKAQEEQMAALASEASFWESLADSELDQAAYQQYKNYANDLDNEISTLAAQGLNPRSRQGFNNMRVRYGKEIAPIVNASETRKRLSEEQRAGRAKDNTMQYDVEAGNISLMDYIKDPSISYRGFSGMEAEKLAGSVASTFQRELRDPQGQWAGTLKGIFGPQYFERVVSNGLSTEDVIKTLQGHPEGNAILKAMGDSVMESTGVRSWNNEAAQNAIQEHINRGLFQAVGQEKLDRVGNQDYNYLQQQALTRQRAAASAAGAPKVNDRMPYKIRQNVSVDKNIKTTELNQKKQWILANADKIVNKDPSIFNQKSSSVPTFYPSTIPGGYVTNSDRAYRQQVSGSNERQKYDDIVRDLGVELNTQQDIDAAIASLDRQISESAKLGQTYDMDLADNKYMIQELNNSSLSFGENAFKRINDNGKIKKAENIEINETANVSFDPNIGLTLVQRGKNGERERFLIDAAMLNNIVNSGEGPSISELVDIIPELIKTGETFEDGSSVAQAYIDNLMWSLDSNFMPAKVQGGTDANVTPSANPWSVYTTGE